MAKTNVSDPPPEFRVVKYDDFDFEDAGAEIGAFPSLEEGIAFARACYRLARASQDAAIGILTPDGVPGPDFMASWAVLGGACEGTPLPDFQRFRTPLALT